MSRWNDNDTCWCPDCSKNTPVGTLILALRHKRIRLATAKLLNTPWDIRTFLLNISDIRSRLRARGISYG